MGKRLKFANNEIYHIYNRGADKRLVFSNNCDRLRFLHGLFIFNDVYSSNVNLTKQFVRCPGGVVDDNDERSAKRKHVPRKPLVEILAFALMPNHFHLLLRQRASNGIPSFMQKLGTGYTLYFNQKHKRNGCLFQGKFKAVHIGTDEQLLHIPFYIHSNPLSLCKNGEVPEKFLESYCWSSHRDYCGLKNFASITQRGFLNDLLGGETEYKRSITQWIKDRKKNGKLIAGVALEALTVAFISVPLFLQSVCDSLSCAI
ncbi:transposase [Patescibacteria group bacterium]|nr:transposase [Patescibacteria group bacterium]